jgi:hypothetical protein
MFRNIEIYVTKQLQSRKKMHPWLLKKMFNTGISKKSTDGHHLLIEEKVYSSDFQ